MNRYTNELLSRDRFDPLPSKHARLRDYLVAALWAVGMLAMFAAFL